MKYLIIFCTPLLAIFMGCSSSENTASNDNIQIISAKVNEWSEPPAQNSDVPERGADLSITVDDWPSNYTPSHIIYNKRKSLSAGVTDTVDGHPIITGRIIRSSYRLPKTSETVSKSNRLVYSNQEGEQFYIEIANWESSKN